MSTSQDDLLDSNTEERINTASWRDSMSQSFRKEIVETMVQAIWLSDSLMEEQYQELIENAENIEAEKFATATSRMEYINLITAQTFKMQNECDLKKQCDQLEALSHPQHQEENENEDENPSNVATDMYTRLREIDISCQVSDIAVAPTKDWQTKVTLNCRMRIMKELVRVALPLTPLSINLDKRIRILVASAKLRELELFQTANSIDEYYKVSAEEIPATHDRLMAIAKQYTAKRKRKTQRMMQSQSGASSEAVVSEPKSRIRTNKRDQISKRLKKLYLASELNMSATKEWQMLFSPKDRLKLAKHLVLLITSMLVEFNKRVPIKIVIPYAKEVEVELFQTANSLAEYHDLAAEKIYALEVRLLDKQDGISDEEAESPIELPDCIASRKLISHFKDDSLRKCSHCRRIMLSKFRRFGAQYFTPKQQRCHSALLKHSCHCQDPTCTNPMCLKMKRAIGHTTVCRNKDPHALLCREISAFSLNHMLVCTQSDCILAMQCGNQ